MTKIKKTCVSITNESEFDTLLRLLEKYNINIYQKTYNFDFKNCYFDTVANSYYCTPYNTTDKVRLTLEELESLFIKKGKNIAKNDLINGTMYKGALPTNQKLKLSFDGEYYIVKGFRGDRFILELFTTFKRAKKEFLK